MFKPSPLPLPAITFLKSVNKSKNSGPNMSDQETHQHGATTTVPDTGDHPITTTATSISRRNGSLKRQSPSPSSFQEPNTKKLSLNGFSRLNLPLSNPIEPSKFSLYRTLSAPIPSSPNPQPQPSVFPNPLSPENVRPTSASPSPSPSPPHCASLPLPIPTVMRRSVSDIASPAYQQVLKTIASPASVCSDSSIRGKSPNFEKVKRLEEMTKEISHWCTEAMRQFENGGSEDNNNPQKWCEEATRQLEQFEEEDAEEDGSDINNPQELHEEEDPVTEMEEAVSIDRAGDCLTIHFECPCGKGYQILLSGKNCYYKLVQY